MNEFNIFDIRQKRTPKNNIYEAIGFPINPFTERGNNAERPFYSGYIENEVDKISQWLHEINNRENYQPLSLVGSIGTGKTRIIGEFVRRIKQIAANNKIMAISVLSSETGYSKVSLGGLLMKGFENTKLAGEEEPPNQEIMPLLWGIIRGKKLNSQESLLERAIYKAQTENQDSEELATLISRWLRRVAITPVQMRKVGFTRKIDWEGELTHELSELIRIANQTDTLQTVYIFIDQLEEIFREAFSELRRARFLTDLRALIDEILERKTPVGLLLAWSPEFRRKEIIGFSDRKSIDNQLKMAYGALYSRLQQQVVNVPFLTDKNFIPFAQTFIDAIKDEPGFNESLQPDIKKVIDEVIQDLKNNNKMLGDQLTPRDLLGALAANIEDRANKASKK